MTATSEYSLTAETREITGKSVKKLRRAGRLPAVVYGHNYKSHHITLDEKAFTKVFHGAGHSSLVSLKIDSDKSTKVLIQDVQLDHVSGQYLHVDLFKVNLKEKLRTDIPLVFVGTPEAVDVLGGTLITVKDTVEVECLPDDLVASIEVDLTPIKTFEDTITVMNLVAPAGIEILDDPEETVVSIAPPRSDEELAELEEAVEENVAAVESETTSGTDVTPTEEEDKK
jgi:large subunit ribosomal protein L25